jgi:hypothetical protein
MHFELAEEIICECCGQVVDATVGTSFTDAYCKDCLALVIFECQEAIKLIEGQE